MLRGDNIVKFWASNAYARVNNLLRHYDIDTLYKTTPYLFTFLQHFIHYFQTQGIYASKIAKKSTYLYRGIDDQYMPSELHRELGFIATSLDKAVSEKFANDGKSPGTLQVFITQVKVNKNNTKASSLNNKVVL